MKRAEPAFIDVGHGSDDVRISQIKPAKVAVLMTVFNGMPYLPEAVESILGQSLEAFEFIIVDDGSPDTTKEYLKSIGDPRATLTEQSRTGQQVAAHRAIEMATALYIARMDSDDVAGPDRLERQVQYLDDHAEVGLIGSQITRRGQSGSGLVSHFPTDHDAIVADLSHNRHSICNPATTFRRQLDFDVGGYSIAQYRKAVAEMHSGKPILGGVRALYWVMCSPLKNFTFLASFSVLAAKAYFRKAKLDVVRRALKLYAQSFQVKTMLNHGEQLCFALGKTPPTRCLLEKRETEASMISIPSDKYGLSL